MNKEEIEKAKEDLSFMNEGDYITREMANSKEILIKYIKSLEIINETYQVINELSEREIKELEQKTETLDKVTDKLKEDRDLFNKLRKTHKEYSPSEERLTTKYFYILNLLNIIEGEEKNEK